MEKRIKPYRIFLLFLIICYCCTANSYSQSSGALNKSQSSRSYRNDLFKNKKVKISYWKNEKFLDTSSKGIFVYISTGFDNTTTFKLFINKKLLNTFKCKTNYSIGYCITDKKNIIPNTFLSYNAFKEGDSFCIQTENETLTIRLSEKMKQYNKLKISKAKETWFAAFENDASITQLE
ncbi:MAG: hypothetical protein ABI112_12280 [Terracoccus sp.]